MHGGLRALFDEYSARVQFACVYVMEAHASDTWPLGISRSTVKQHRTLDERIAAAR